MPRPLIVLLLAGVVFGSLAGYARFLATLPPSATNAHVAPPASGTFRLEVRLSFDTGIDPFGLPHDPTLLVRSAGQDLIRRTDAVMAQEMPVLDGAAGIVAGRNAFYVRAVPADDYRRHACALQLRVLRDGRVLKEATLWSEPGDVVSGEVRIDLSEPVPSASPAEGGHLAEKGKQS